MSSSSSIRYNSRERITDRRSRYSTRTREREDAVHVSIRREDAPSLRLETPENRRRIEAVIERLREGRRAAGGVLRAESPSPTGERLREEAGYLLRRGTRSYGDSSVIGVAEQAVYRRRAARISLRRPVEPVEEFEFELKSEKADTLAKPPVACPSMDLSDAVLRSRGITGQLFSDVLSFIPQCSNSTEGSETALRLRHASQSTSDGEQRLATTVWHHLQQHETHFDDFLARCRISLESSGALQGKVEKFLQDASQQQKTAQLRDPLGGSWSMSEIFYKKRAASHEHEHALRMLSWPHFCHAACPNSIRDVSATNSLLSCFRAGSTSPQKKRGIRNQRSDTPNVDAVSALPHVCRSWVLIINQAIFTCSGQPLQDLLQPTISRMPDDAPGSHIYVTSMFRRWSIPTHDYSAWPSFLSLFRSHLARPPGRSDTPFTPVFYFQQRELDAVGWGDILDLADQRSVTIQMRRDVKWFDLHGVKARYSMTTPFAESSRPVKRGAAPRPRFDPSKTAFGAFCYMEGPLPLHSLTAVAEKLHQAAGNKLAYSRATGGKASQLDSLLEEIAIAQASSKKDPVKLRTCKLSTEFAWMAQFMFAFFWPWNEDHPVIEKYWGAVIRILERRAEMSSQDARDRLRLLKGFVRLLEYSVFPVAVSIVSDFKGHEQRLSPLPENFHQAWLHLLTAVLLIGDESTLSEDNTTDTSSDTSSNSSSDSSSDSTNIYFTNSDKSDENLAEKHLRRVTQELYDGRHALDLRLASTSSQDLRNFELSDARGVAALVIDNLSSHRVAPPYSVLGMYDSHLAKISKDIEREPHSPSHQEPLDRLIKSLTAIIPWLQDHRETLSKFGESPIRSLARSSTDPESHLRATLRPFHEHVFSQCTHAIDRQRRAFEDQRRLALELQYEYGARIQRRRSRQDNMIFVFTVVTVLFLPASFIASVFGMNARDVKDMDVGQWAFWVTALSVTALVVCAAMWFAGMWSGVWVRLGLGGDLGKKGEVVE